MIGKTISHYEILEKLGAGGMGEVYKARDVSLDRLVALKFLKPHIDDDELARKRFVHEAKAASALDHSSVGTIYQIAQTDDGRTFIAMAYYGGESLADEIRRGPLEFTRALDLAIEVGEGLAEAHRHDIVHRDVKPGNVIVTDRGEAKIVDFGLAKLAGQTKLTKSGAAVGTIGYMSPEQAQGRDVDRRADIWALGALLYEALVGHPPFHGTHEQAIVYSIINLDPEPLTAQRAGLPLEIDRVVGKALAKDPAERFQSMDDMLVDLRALRAAAAKSSSGTRAASRAATRWRRTAWALVFVAGLVGIAAGIGGSKWLAPSATEPVRFERLTYRSGYFTNARFAPDGQTVFYAAAWGDQPRELFQGRPATGGELSLGLPGADLLSVSAAGELAMLLPRFSTSEPYWKSGTLAVVPASGGTPRELVDAVVWADWAPDGKSLAVVRQVGSIRTLEWPVGNVIHSVPHEGLLWPRISPDGREVALYEQEDAWSVISVDREGRRTVLSPGWNDWWPLDWSPKGDEVWFSGSKAGYASSLYAVNRSGKLRTLLTAPGTLELHDVAADGRVLVGTLHTRNHVFGREMRSNSERSLSLLELTGVIDLSDDGRFLLLGERSEREGGVFGVYLREMNGAAAVRLGDGWGRDLSADGRWALAQRGRNEIVALPTGPGEPRVRALPVAQVLNVRFLPDGERVAAVVREKEGTTQLVVTDLGTEPLRRVGAVIAQHDPLGGLPLVVSPDGRFVCLSDSASGIVIVALESGERTSPAVFRYGERPIQWTADGRRLYIYDRTMLPAPVFTVDIATGERLLALEIAPPDAAGVGGIKNVALTRDGSAYAYHYSQYLSVLYLVEGLR